MKKPRANWNAVLRMWEVYYFGEGSMEGMVMYATRNMHDCGAQMLDAARNPARHTPREPSDIPE